MRLFLPLICVSAAAQETPFEAEDAVALLQLRKKHEGSEEALEEGGALAAANYYYYYTYSYYNDPDPAPPPPPVPENPPRCQWETSPNVDFDGSSFSKQGGGSTYNAYAVLCDATQITVNANQGTKHVRLGLTSNADDNHMYPNGRYVGLFPNGRMYLPPFPDNSYTTGDAITVRLSSRRLSVLKNGVVLGTWDNDFDSETLFAKLHIYEVGAGMTLAQPPEQQEPEQPQADLEDGEWTMSNNLVVNGPLISKSSGGSSYNAQAFTCEQTEISVRANQENRHVRLGLTSDSNDDHMYPNGRYVGLFPSGRMYLPPFADNTYTRDDTITMRLSDGRLSVLKNGDVLATWDNDIAAPTLCAKLNFYENGAGLSVV